MEALTNKYPITTLSSWIFASASSSCSFPHPKNHLCCIALQSSPIQTLFSLSCLFRLIPGFPVRTMLLPKGRIFSPHTFLFNLSSLKHPNRFLICTPRCPPQDNNLRTVLDTKGDIVIPLEFSLTKSVVNNLRLGGRNKLQ